ncbi:zinc ribbon domain-containing protein [Aggregicoccus sp. 17bor-14]|uniref:double zinc ribbon domain-containing protein n=1 Tax=Myxococcaceae TaxID=31 RepID=UPI00129C78A2|nr:MULTISPECIES: zinc ribbon domain-containing protein [Myxococcaceae]MBF5046081.1 zinc ribbon domain-containing protein [Simulacricoccus sp. 17bor-14]MRI91810.1 zinc ribbon domain-containing protein [Aggregicoccus sp. 17bor-14]
MIQFTRNYSDRSNDSGFQFEFFCDKCGNGHMSPFVTSKLSLASSVLKAAASLFGGAASSAAYAGDHLKDAMRGKAWDEAYSEAVKGGREHFEHCTRCGKWVCPEACWNAARGLCEECAPDLAEEAASIQAHVAVEQTWEKARGENQVAHLDMKAPRTVACPHCSARVEGGKFCPECGKGLSTQVACGGCGAQVPAAARLCPECGQPPVKPGRG